MYNIFMYFVYVYIILLQYFLQLLKLFYVTPHTIFYTHAYTYIKHTEVKVFIYYFIFLNVIIT